MNYFVIVIVLFYFSKKKKILAGISQQYPPPPVYIMRSLVIKISSYNTSGSGHSFNVDHAQQFDLLVIFFIIFNKVHSILQNYKLIV